MRGLLGQLDSQCQEAKFSLGVDSLFPLWNISSSTTITTVFKMLFLLYMYACLRICEHICLHISGTYCMCAYVSPYVCGHICIWYMGQGVCLHTHACVCLQMSKVMLGIFFNLFYLIHRGRVSRSTPELADMVSHASSLLWASLPLLSEAGMTGEYLSYICMGTWDLHFHSLASGASTLLCELPSPPLPSPS